MVMLRDISHAVSVKGHQTVVACVVLDVGTGLMLGATVAEGYPQACLEAFKGALTAPVPGAQSSPGPPGRVVCAPDHVADIDDQLRALIGSQAPAAEGIIPGAEAEDIVDSLVGHLVGRPQPADPPTPEDWSHLIGLTAGFAEGQPWNHLNSGEVGHTLTIALGDETTTYVAVVLGEQGLQRGLVLYPGTDLPQAVGSWQPGQPATVPDGALMCYLDPDGEAPREAVDRALRYGWPPDAELFPLFVTMHEGELADIGRRDAHHLALGLAAVLQQGAVSENSAEIHGSITLPSGDEATYAITASAW